VSYRLRAVGAGALALLLASACSRGPSGVRRIAILPFENLSADARFEWAGRALAEVVASQIIGSPDAHAIRVSALRDVPLDASAVLHGYFSIAGGKLRVDAVLEDVRTHRTLKTAAAAGELLPVAGSIARQLDPHARPYSAPSETALRALVEAQESADPATATQAFNRAVQAGPGYGAAYVGWAQWMISHGQSAQASAATRAALAEASRLPAIERAQIEVLSAALAGDAATERKALVALARVTPADAAVFRNLASLDLRMRACPSAVQWYGRALALDPDNVALLNESGYAHACARDLESAVKNLSRYRDLRPHDANPLDSLGDVNFYLGRFDAAAKSYLEAHTKDPGFLLGSEPYKAAWANLMAGDLKSADDNFGRFLEMRRANKDMAAPYRQAQWEFLTGRRKQALARMEEISRPSQSPLASLAAQQLSIWRLELGERSRQPVFSQAARPYALLLSGKFQEAIEPLQASRSRTSPTSEESPDVLLAWSLIETDRWKETPDLLAVNPVPDPLRDNPFRSLSFPRIFYLRAVVFDKQGRREEAKNNYRLFLHYSGDLPTASGDESRAAARLKSL